MKLKVLPLLIAVAFSLNLLGQKDNPVLFSVDGAPVHLSEFKYIYSKTNGQKADFSKASLQEYLDLYTNFKLKVHKAKEMRLDTIVALQQELDGYRKQLADSYLIDREVTEKLVEEAYERSRQDVDISHIMILAAANASPEDTLKAWNRALEAKKKLEMGEGFETVAQAYSEDQSVQKNKGRIGFVTALFPNGFYALETAAYKSPLGKVAGPIRSNSGYHVLLAHNRRPARGEVEVAHILIRLDIIKNTIDARLAIDSIYTELKKGADFEELAKARSHDKISATKGGYVGFFGINRYEQSFEDAAFGLAKDGDYTTPVQTSIGWHIIKRISRKENEEFAAVKSRLQNQIKEDARFEMSRQAMVGRIKKGSGFQENLTTLQDFVGTLELDTAQSFLTYKWKAPETPSTQALFSFGNSLKQTVGDFANYAQRASRKRQQFANLGIKEVARMLYQDFVDETALQYEERQLEAKYPDFKSLMREYEEGILLFEVTKMEVWDKASQDTVGLQAFYNQHQQKYKWDQRAVISQYSLQEKAKDQLNPLREFAGANGRDAVINKFNPADGGPIVSVIERTYEKGRNEVLDKMDWKVGQLSPIEINKRDNSYNFFKIEEILPTGQKTLQESRGYVIADYQDYLEKKWLQDLKKEYKVVQNEKVFNSLVKK